MQGWKYIFLCFFSCLCGVAVAFTYGYLRHQPIPDPVYMSPNSSSSFSLATAPSESLIGSVSSLMGEVDWLSRVATEPARLTSQHIQQGESLMTQKNSSVTISFASVAEIAATSSTQLAFIQTLPVDLVIDQASGSAIYTRLSTATPLSIRSLDLLTQIASGSAQISVNSKNGSVIVLPLSGSTIEAHEDSDQNTQIITVPLRHTFIFDNDTKESSLQRS